VWLRARKTIRGPPANATRTSLDSQNHETWAKSNPLRPFFRSLLEDQIAWYDRKSMSNQRAYRRIKITEILAAAVIPFLAAPGLAHTSIVTAGLGVLITVLEGLLHLNQYQQNWINYRSTCEALKHEKYTYLGGGAPRQCSRSTRPPSGTHRVAGVAGARQVGIGSAAGTR
jgi:hypothetical protein